ncbi:MAG: prepilin-type N-terminal cleavage/methylation domain-containing protein [Granulosicoccus sp.]|nr:prepilin-type N-terminal cleavage/methylation domain-containing protein [Granulosicoccus sp.]
MTTMRRRITGFTLLELMIALGIGTTVTVTGLTLYQQTTQSRNLIQAELATQESSYLLHQVLRHYINQAGYRPLGNIPSGSSVLPVKLADDAFAAVSGNWDKGQFFKLVDNGFAIRFEGASASDGSADATFVDCVGSAIAAGTVAEVEFKVDDGLFLCTTDETEVQLIASDDDVRIEQFGASLGVDRNNDLNADVYLSATDTLLPGDDVVAVRLSFLLASVSEVKPSNGSYKYDGIEYVSTDKKLRHESVVAVQLKNR